MWINAKESFAQVGENRKMKNGMELGSDDVIGFPNTETSEKIGYGNSKASLNKSTE